MLNRKFVTVFGVVGLVVMAVLLVLVWFKLVPTEYYLPLFFVAFVIWAGRLIMRVMLARKERRESGNEQGMPGTDPGIHKP